MADPSIPDDRKAALVHRLMDARRAVRDTKRASDIDAEVAAHHAVDDAKQALGERGPVGWDDAPRISIDTWNLPYATRFAKRKHDQLETSIAKSSHLRSGRHVAGFREPSRDRLARSHGEVWPRRRLRTGAARSERAATSSSRHSRRMRNGETMAWSSMPGAANVSEPDTCR